MVLMAVPRPLLALNGAACCVYIAYTLARHLPLECFPTQLRPQLLRWRRTRRAPKRPSVLVDAQKTKRSNPFDTAAAPQDAQFKAWPSLNEEKAANLALGFTSRRRLDQPQDPLFIGSSLQARLSRELASRKALDRKEFFEAFEFFAQTKDQLGGPKGGDPVVLVDAAGGHGLLGILCACLEPSRCVPTEYAPWPYAFWRTPSICLVRCPSLRLLHYVLPRMMLIQPLKRSTLSLQL